MGEGVRNRLTTMSRPRPTFDSLDRRTRRFVGFSLVTGFTTLILAAYLLPLGFMTMTALKSGDQISDPNQEVLPRSAITVEIDGRDRDVLVVPLDGGDRNLALVKPGRQESIFVDPSDPGTEIRWTGNWRTLEPVQELDVQWDNFGRAWESLDFLRLTFNTGVIAGFGMAGTVVSSTLVAYGLSRFRIPYANLIMVTLIATIIMPRFVTLVPTYAIYNRIGWVGTWLPLIVPHFFANAYNVFLLRQFFLTIPKDLDEAASIDGAGPLRILWSIILPQAKGAVVAISLFHFFYVWNDFFEPLIYLAGNRDRLPISVGLYDFLGLYDSQAELIQAGAMLGLAIPVAVFLVMQRFFLSGIDLSGSIK